MADRALGFGVQPTGTASAQPARSDATAPPREQAVAKTPATKEAELDRWKEEARRLAEALRREHYFNQIARAQSAFDHEDLVTMAALLADCEEDLRGWEWYRLNRIRDVSLRTITAGRGPLQALAVSPDGQRIVTAQSVVLPISKRLRKNAEAELSIWNMKTGERLGALSGVRMEPGSIVFSPDGRRLAAGRFEVHVWDAQTLRPIVTLSGPPGSRVNALAFSPDGSRLVTAGGRNEPGRTGAGGLSRRAALTVWDVEHGTEIYDLNAHLHPVASVAWSRDGRWIVSADPTNSREFHNLIVWNAATGKLAFSLPGHRYGTRAVALSPDGKHIFSGGAGLGGFEVRAWSMESRKTLFTIPGFQKAITSLAVSPDGRSLLTTQQDKTVRLWDARTGALRRALIGHVSVVRIAAFMPERQSRFATGHVVSAGDDGVLKLWETDRDPTALTLAGHSRGVLAVAFQAGGNEVVTTSAASETITWDAATGRPTSFVYNDLFDILSSAAGPTARRFAIAGRPYSMHVDDLKAGRRPVAMTVLDQTRKQAHYDIFGPLSGLRAVAFSPDGSLIATGDLNGGRVVIRRARDGLQLRSFCAGPTGVLTIRFHPDGRRIAVGLPKGELQLWDATTMAPLWDSRLLRRGRSESSRRSGLGGLFSRLSALAAPNGPHLLAFSPDGLLLAYVRSGTVTLYEVETGEPLRSLEGYEGSPASVAFHPDGTRIITGNTDGTVNVWETRTGRLTLTLRGHQAPVTSVAFDPRGRRIVSGDSRGVVKVWDAGTIEESKRSDGP